MHCIIVRENCPERYFVEVIGPFDTYADATDKAAMLEHSRYNIDKDRGRRNTYQPTTMVKPEEA